MSSDTPAPIRRGPMEIGELFGGAMTLSARTMGNAGIVTVVVLIICSMLVGLATQSYLDSLVTSFTSAAGINANKNPEAFQKAMMPMIGAMVMNLGVQFLYLLVIVFMQVLLVLAGWYAAHGEKIGLGSLVGMAFKRSYWMSAIQTLMMVIFFFIIYLALVIVGALAGVPAVSVYLFLIFLAWFTTKIVTRLQLIAIEDRGPWQGMMASMTLSKDNWWRSFLIVLVPTVVVVGITLLISIPVMGGKGIVDMSSTSMQTGKDADFGALAVQMRHVRDALSTPFFGITGLLTGIYIVFLTHLSTVLYIDLKGRRGDFDLDDDDQEPSPSTESIA